MDKLKLQSKIDIILAQVEYEQAAQNYENLVNLNPKSLENYWYLGLIYLLQDQEDSAGLVWFSAVSEQDDETSAVFSLVEFLDLAADSLSIRGQNYRAWATRHYVREFAPQNLPNLLKLCNLSFTLEELTGEVLAEIGVIDVLQSSASKPGSSLIEETLETVLQVPDAETLDFAEACISYFSSLDQWALRVVTAAATMGFKWKLGNFAIALLELCLKHDPENIKASIYLPRFLTETQQYGSAIAVAQNFHQSSTTLETRFLASCVLLQALMRTGDWSEVPVIAEQFKVIVSEILQNKSTQLPLYVIQFLIVNIGLFSYLQDNLIENRKLQNQVGSIFSESINAITPKSFQSTAIFPDILKKRLKIGYIGSTFRRHSVGWLSRWLFQYHDRSKFEVCVYLVQQDLNDEFFQAWFLNNVDQVKVLSLDAGVAAEGIRSDQLDILIDLDSITLDFTCTVLAQKPAQIQVTWLGCDASGLPAIDYFIADPYVLPDDAQDYYQEKIWRLPNTYVAVNGFEIGTPTLQRSDLEIPEDSIVYLSSQVGFKRHPETIRLQMKILKEVPNSFFIIKGLGDQKIISELFIEIAEKEGVERDRLKFLPMVLDEYTHRANLQLADIALDTYPYNGATTSLEVLWSGIPLVTRVGDTFSSRNSYSFLRNLSICEGIAYTDEEYIEWGIRFGKDMELRQEIYSRLMVGRKNSYLWNAKYFTLKMEEAYCEMCFSRHE